MEYLKAFLCGGILCAIGQILIDKTKLTPARILTGGISATAGGISAAVVFAVLMALLFKPGNKR